jgi:hypothetical protein
LLVLPVRDEVRLGGAVMCSAVASGYNADDERRGQRGPDLFGYGLKATGSMREVSRSIARVAGLSGRLARAGMMCMNMWKVVWAGMRHTRNVRVFRASLMIELLIHWCCQKMQ